MPLLQACLSNAGARRHDKTAMDGKVTEILPMVSFTARVAHCCN